MNDQQFNTFLQQMNHAELMNHLEGKTKQQQYVPRARDKYMPTIIACVGFLTVLYFLVK